VEEGQEIMKEYKGMPALDAGLVAVAQAVEHYEISRYGTLKTWASELGLSVRRSSFSTRPCRKRRRRMMHLLNWPKVASTSTLKPRNKQDNICVGQSFDPSFARQDLKQVDNPKLPANDKSR
jgi:hypothetical protein